MHRPKHREDKGGLIGVLYRGPPSVSSSFRLPTPTEIVLLSTPSRSCLLPPRPTIFEKFYLDIFVRTKTTLSVSEYGSPLKTKENSSLFQIPPDTVKWERSFFLIESNFYGGTGDLDSYEVETGVGTEIFGTVY